MQHSNMPEIIETKNRKHRRAAAKPSTCTKPAMLSTLESKGGREVGKEIGRDGGRRKGEKEKEAGRGET